MGLWKTSESFLNYLEARKRSTLDWKQLIQEAGGPEKVALLGVDLLCGFCKEGPLASPRVAQIVEPAVRLVRQAHDRGIRNFFYPSDSHPEDSPEFQAFPPHCLEGTQQSELVEELTSLPFAGLFEIIAKRSLGSFVGTDLMARLQDFHTLICFGDCTDLCLYQLALPLRLEANTHHKDWRIIVVEEAVQTYDLPTETALPLNLMPHPGDLFHEVFLYHLELNGVEVVASLR